MNNFRTFRRKKGKGKRFIISREAVSKAVTAYLDGGGKITKMEVISPTELPPIDNIHDADNFLTGK